MEIVKLLMMAYGMAGLTVSTLATSILFMVRKHPDLLDMIEREADLKKSGKKDRTLDRLKKNSFISWFEIFALFVLMWPEFLYELATGQEKS